MALRKPWHDGNRSAYHGADRVADIAEGFKRCRKEQSFILADDGVLADKPVCAACKEPITVKSGNRGHYYPSSKRYEIFHYNCSWGAIFNDLESLMERMS